MALDLGTHCGIAHNLSGPLVAFTKHLATAKEVTAWGQQRLTRRLDPRIPRLAAILAELPTPDLVVWEDVAFSTYTLQTQLWSSFRTTIWLTCGERSILDCVPVSALKKFATGHGGATKEMMQHSLKVCHPEIDCANLDDNAVDATWIFLWASKTLSRIKT